MQRYRNTDPRPQGFDFDPPEFEFIYLEDSFKAAINHAKSCATGWNCVAKIEPTENSGWAVWVDASVEEIREQIDVDPYDFEEEPEETNDEYIERIAREEKDRAQEDFDEEMRSYQGGYARSNEDGWYYGDDY